MSGHGLASKKSLLKVMAVFLTRSVKCMYFFRVWILCLMLLVLYGIVWYLEHL